MALLRFFPKAPAKTSGLFIGHHIEPMSFQQTVCSIMFGFFSFVGEFPWNEDINELDEKQCCKYFNPLLCSPNKNVTRQRCSCHNSTESDRTWAYALIFSDQDFKCPERLKNVTWDTKRLCCWTIKQLNQQSRFMSALLNHLFPLIFWGIKHNRPLCQNTHEKVNIAKRLRL